MKTFWEKHVESTPKLLEEIRLRREKSAQDRLQGRIDRAVAWATLWADGHSMVLIAKRARLTRQRVQQEIQWILKRIGYEHE